MDREIKSQANIDEDVLTFDLPDDALERAASAERQAFTWAYCTNGWYWYDCSVQQQLRQLGDTRCDPPR
jgi:hypothetical protein